jgi:voltage-gated potassium channel
MQLTIDFIQLFFLGIYFITPILLIFIFIVLLLGQIVGRMEVWDRFDAFYWSFITAFTVGYGDLRPIKKSSKIISMFIALIGIIFTGIIVAVTIVAITKSFEKNIHYKPILKSHHLNQYNS